MSVLRLVAEGIHDRWPLAWAWISVSFAAVGVATSCVGCASIRMDGLEVRPGIRVLAICKRSDGAVEVRAYPMSRAFAGSAVLVGVVIGAAVGAPLGPGPAAAGAGAGAVIGGLIEIVAAVRGLWSVPDPEPSCEPGGPAPTGEVGPEAGVGPGRVGGLTPSPAP